MKDHDPRHGRPATHEAGPDHRSDAAQHEAQLPARVNAARVPCFVAPDPKLREKMTAELGRLRKRSTGLGAILGSARDPRTLGFNDGMILPPENFPFGTREAVLRNSGLDRAPLRGAVRVIVVLVDTSDKAMTTPASHFQDLFFSEGVVATGSVREYYREVTGGLVDIVGEVVGPYRLPHTMAWYANGNFGIGKPSGTTRARDMAADALALADPNVNFGPYDNDGNGFVDAFIVIHSGSGGEQTGNPGDIWSHKWVLANPVTTDTTKVYAYLTIPEDAKLGVSAHELGHLLFGFPDLYDTDYTSEGVGNWCLMGGGSWNGGGDTPAHPSAWCKANQGWASVNNITANGAISIPDVKTSRQVHRLWKDGAAGQEYFLLENRQRTGFDAELPGDGLLLWHIDDAQSGNTDESHYKVGLVQADGARDLEENHNRGDAGDPFPGSANVTTVSGTTTPNTNSYTGQSTLVSVTAISPSAATMTATVTVRATKNILKDAKDTKEGGKDHKELKEYRKDTKELGKDLKDRIKDRKEIAKDAKDVRKEVWEKRPDSWGHGGLGGWPGGGEQAAPGQDPIATATQLLQQALEILGSLGGEPGEAFIDESLRPDLIGGATWDEHTKAMAEGDPRGKRGYDTAPQG